MADTPGASQPQPGGSSAAGLDRTLNVAFGLAVRILDDNDAASAACESAYQKSTRGRPWSNAFELGFLREVRAESLALKSRGRGRSRFFTSVPPGSYDGGNAVRAAMAAAGETGRRAIELCYFGGLTADEAADLMSAPPAEVRSAMRKVLLAISNACPA